MNKEHHVCARRRVGEPAVSCERPVSYVCGRRRDVRLLVSELSPPCDNEMRATRYVSRDTDVFLLLRPGDGQILQDSDADQMHDQEEAVDDAEEIECDTIKIHEQHRQE